MTPWGLTQRWSVGEVLIDELIHRLKEETVPEIDGTLAGGLHTDSVVSLRQYDLQQSTQLDIYHLMQLNASNKKIQRVKNTASKKLDAYALEC